MYDRRNHAKRLFFGGIVLGHCAAVWLALVELAFLSLSGRAARLMEVTGPSVLGYEVLVVLLAGPLAGLLLGAVVAGVHLMATGLAPQRRMEPVFKARAYAALSVPWAAWVAQQAFSGPRAQTLPYRTLLSFGLGFALIGGVWLVGRAGAKLAVRLAAGHTRLATRIVLPPLLLAGAAGLHVADALLLRRLYPFFHWSLAGGALISAWLGAGALHLALGRTGRRRVGRLARPSWTVTAAIALFALGLLGQRQVGRSNQLRALLFERTATAAKVLALSARVGILPAPEPIRPRLEPARPAPRGRRRAAVQAHPGALRRADVVLITVDAMRADRLGLLGFRRRVSGPKPVSITPNLDRIFGAGLVFHRAYTPTPRTSYALVSLLTGMPLHPLWARGIEQHWPTLAEVLARRGGYHTAAFYPRAVFTIDARHFRRYQLEHLGFGAFHFEGHEVTAAQRTDQVLAYLDGPGRSAKPLFLWVHYFDPHEPYRLQPGYEAFGQSPRARYEAELAYVDAQVGRLVTGIRRRRGARVLYVLAADHGEEFGEHGGTNHGTTLFDEQVRVPLALAGPGLPAEHVRTPVSLLWVAATVARLVGVVPPQPMGQWPLLTAVGRLRAEPPSAVVAHLDALAMVAGRRHKLIQDRRRGYLALYDLQVDPGERHPVDIDAPGAARKAAARLLGALVAWEARLARLARRSERLDPAGLRLALAAGDPFRRRTALNSLLRLAVEQRLHSRFAKAAASPRGGPQTRRGAHRGRGLADPRLQRTLTRRLRDPDVQVRHAALLALCLADRLPPKHASTLKKLAARWDLPRHLALGVGLCLARQQDPEASRLLAAHLTDAATVEMRLALVRILGTPSIATADSVLALTRALEDVELARESLRALGRLARDPGTHALAAWALPWVRAALPTAPEHAGIRAAALETLGAMGGPAAQAEIAHWLSEEPDPAVQALGLALLATGRDRPVASTAVTPRWRSCEVGSPPPTSSRAICLLPLPSPWVDAPKGACLPGRGCRLEPSPTTVTWPLPTGRFAPPPSLWVMTEVQPDEPPELTVFGQALSLQRVPRLGRPESPAAAVHAWRVPLPPGLIRQIETRRVLRVGLRDPSGKGVVVRALGLL